MCVAVATIRIARASCKLMINLREEPSYGRRKACLILSWKGGHLSRYDVFQFLRALAFDCILPLYGDKGSRETGIHPLLLFVQRLLMAQYPPMT
jgi:hypothetical protein